MRLLLVTNMFLLVLLAILPMANAEWRRSATNFTKRGERYNIEFVKSVFSVGSPYFSASGDMYYVLNDSVPISFEDTEYYWNDTYIKRALQICEYQVGQTFKADKTPVKTVYYECGLSETCEGLECGPPSMLVYFIGGVVILVLIGTASTLAVNRKHKWYVEQAKLAMQKELDDRPIESGRTADTAV